MAGGTGGVRPFGFTTMSKPNTIMIKPAQTKNIGKYLSNVKKKLTPITHG